MRSDGKQDSSKLVSFRSFLEIDLHRNTKNNSKMGKILRNSTCKWLHFLVLVGVVILLQPTGHSKLTRIEVIATSASEFNFSFTIRIVSSFGIEVCFTLSNNVSDDICSDSSTVMAHCLVVPLKKYFIRIMVEFQGLYLSSFHEQLI